MVDHVQNLELTYLNPEQDRYYECSMPRRFQYSLSSNSNSHYQSKMEDYQRLRLQCPEYITLLWSLTETPGDFKTYRDSAEEQSSRKLLLIEEKQLADAFAFIASWKDNPDDVMAVCVEEGHSPDAAITIRVASNSGNPSGIVDRLRYVASIMMRATDRSKITISKRRTNVSLTMPAIPRLKLQQEMFGQIVEICTDRILSRLRSQHARRTRRTIGRPRLPPQMLEAVNRCALVAAQEMEAITRQVVREAEAISKAFDLVEMSSKGKSRTLRLMDVVKTASQCDLTALRQMLSIDRSLEPTMKSHLPKAISKLARYFELSKYLINAARTERHSLFYNIKFMAVGHPAFDPQHLVGPFRDFDHLLHEHGWQKHKNAGISETKYHARLTDPRAIWKVHAEIQILIFYETTPQSIQPRIISASKLACFCCDLLLRSHGSFRSPGTHGKIYNTWILPELPDDVSARIRPALQRFLSELRHTLIPTAMERKRPCPPPAESAIFDLQPCSSNSTLQQRSTSSLSVRERVSAYHRISVMQSAGPPPTFMRPRQIANPKESARTMDITASPVMTLGREYSETSKSVSADGIMLTNGTANIVLSFGDLSANKVVQKMVNSDTTALIKADALRLFLSVQRLSEKAMRSRSADHFSTFSVRLEEVGRSECTEEKLEQGYPVIDLRTLTPGRDYTIPVGAAALLNRVILRNNEQQLLLSLADPENYGGRSRASS